MSKRPRVVVVMFCYRDLVVKSAVRVPEVGIKSFEDFSAHPRWTSCPVY